MREGKKDERSKLQGCTLWGDTWYEGIKVVVEVATCVVGCNRWKVNASWVVVQVEDEEWKRTRKVSEGKENFSLSFSFYPFTRLWVNEWLSDDGPVSFVRKEKREREEEKEIKEVVDVEGTTKSLAHSILFSARDKIVCPVVVVAVMVIHRCTIEWLIHSTTQLDT